MKRYKFYPLLVFVIMFSLVMPTGVSYGLGNAKPLAANSVTTIASSQATYAQAGYPNTPTGSSQRNMYLGYDSTYSKKQTRIYLQYSLPSLGNVNIVSARIQLGQYVAEASSNYAVTAYRVTESWQENVLTWNTQPAKAEAVGIASFSTSLGTKEIDITETVRHWYAGTYSNYGITIWANNESAPGGIFCSRAGTAAQCGNQINPKLTIEYAPAADTTAPTGNITSPANNATVALGLILLSANAADDTAGSGVQGVKFKVSYNGQWQDISTDTTAPYEASWTTPPGILSKQVYFAIDVSDNAGNIAVDAGGQITVNLSAVQNWIPDANRAYLNQRSLGGAYDSKCGSASAAMMLAMNGLIAKDYATLKKTANAIYPKTISNGSIYLYLITKQMRLRGLNAREVSKSASAAWPIIKTEINAGRPVMLLSRKVTAGHFIVVVGYTEQGSSKKIIVYDPYGKWLGKYLRYDKNSTSSASSKGKWVIYDYTASWGGGWMVTAKPSRAGELQLGLEFTPDLTSQEPLDEVIFDGVSILP